MSNKVSTSQNGGRPALAIAAQQTAARNNRTHPTGLEIEKENGDKMPSRLSNNSSACAKTPRTFSETHPAKCSSAEIPARGTQLPSKPAKGRAYRARRVLEAQRRIRLRKKLRRSPENRKTNSPRKRKDGYHFTCCSASSLNTPTMKWSCATGRNAKPSLTTSKLKQMEPNTASAPFTR